MDGATVSQNLKVAAKRTLQSLPKRVLCMRVAANLWMDTSLAVYQDGEQTNNMCVSGCFAAAKHASFKTKNVAGYFLADFGRL